MHGVMIGEHASSTVDHGFEPTSGEAKDYYSGICCFSAKHAVVLLVTCDMSLMF